MQVTSAHNGLLALSAVDLTTGNVALTAQSSALGTLQEESILLRQVRAACEFGQPRCDAST